MSKEAKKFAKKKEREREVRKKLLAKKQVNTQQARERRKWEKEDRESRSKQRPIFNSELAAAEQLKQQKIRLALEHNLQILKALEEEYLGSLSEEDQAKAPDFVALTRKRIQEIKE